MGRVVGRRDGCAASSPCPPRPLHFALAQLGRIVPDAFSRHWRFRTSWPGSHSLGAEKQQRKQSSIRKNGGPFPISKTTQSSKKFDRCLASTLQPPNEQAWSLSAGAVLLFPPDTLRRSL